MSKNNLWSLLFKVSPRQTFYALLIIAMFVLGIGLTKRIRTPISSELETLVSQSSLLRLVDSDIHPISFYSKRTFSEVYEGTDYAPVWVSGEGKLYPYTYLFINRIKKAYYDGLNPADYHFAEISSIIKQVYQMKEGQPEDKVSLAMLDILLTDAFVAYASHQYAGRVHSKDFNTEWGRKIREINPVDSLNAIKNGADIRPMLNAFICPHSGYLRLKAALCNYYEAKDPEFTLEERNLIVTNMERWRWLPRTMPAQYAMVDIAESKLWLRDHDTDTLGMKIMVGKCCTPLPLFEANLNYLVLNPCWEVPVKIAAEEMLPEIQGDAAYFDRNHMKVFNLQNKEINASQINWDTITTRNFNYKFRQSPGPWNALGMVKFILPNKHDVYFHDASDTELFEKDARTFSHGSIRIEKPLALASFLLQKDTGWIKNKIAGQKTVMLKVPHPLNVYICYWTARIDPDKQVSLFEDIYGYDEMLYELLMKGEAPAEENVVFID